MPTIKMIRTTLGANDGITVLSYEAGTEYDLSNDLASNFLGQGVAERVAPAATEPIKVATEPEDQEQGPGPTASKVVAPDEAKPAPKRGGRGGAR